MQPYRTDLVLCNQDLDYFTLSSSISDDCSRIIFLSTHHYFAYEMRLLDQLFKNQQLIFETFSEYFSDYELEAIDDKAYSQTLLLENPYLFFELSRKIKNQHLLKKVLSKYSITEIIYNSGLGITPDVWISYAKIHNYRIRMANGFFQQLSQKRSRTFPCTRFVPYFVRIYKFLSFKDRWLVIYSNYNSFFFYHDINRVPVCESASQCLIPGFLIVLIKLLPVPKSILRKLFGRRFYSIKESKFSTTIHNFSTESNFFNKKPFVFVDGLHPPNYHPSYGLLYANYRIVRRADFDHRWFDLNNSIVLSYSDIVNEYKLVQFQSLIKQSNAHKHIDRSKKITLFLNHAGDWSALIERSDTDRVIETFMNCAVELPHFNFCIRAHPSMATQEHEGINSTRRLRTMVKSYGINNVVFSNNSLEDDIKMSSICVSEYSDLVLTCILSSIKSITLNPLRRRNFLQFLVDEGLPEAKSSLDLKNFILNNA